MSASLRIQSGGSGDPVLLLLHGLGATSDVWRGLAPVLGRGWPGRWIAPDLPGHGGSAPRPEYSFDAFAAAVAPAVPPTSHLAVLGHSLGGVIGLELANGAYGVAVAAVAGLGIKVAWAGEELARARALAQRANPVYPTRREAAERYLKIAGLVGLIDADAVPDEALVQQEGGWTTAFDPKAFAVGAPDMPSLLRSAKGEVVLAAGANDPMCLPEQLRAIVPDPVILEGLGHNAHVESPEALLPLLSRLLP